MTSREIYKRFSIKANKNDTNGNINILPAVFVLLYNTEAVRWLGEKLDESDDWKINHIKSLLVTDYEATIEKKNKDNLELKVPDDLYRISSSYSIAEKGNCKERIIYNFEKNPIGHLTNIIGIFQPSFDYEEAPYIMTSKGINLFFSNDYEVKKTFIDYYKTPKPIDIAGYTKFDGSQSQNIDCDDLDEANIDEILNRLTVEAFRQFQDTEGIPIAKDRINTES